MPSWPGAWLQERPWGERPRACAKSVNVMRPAWRKAQQCGGLSTGLAGWPQGRSLPFALPVYHPSWVLTASLSDSSLWLSVWARKLHGKNPLGPRYKWYKQWKGRRWWELWEFTLTLLWGMFYLPPPEAFPLFNILLKICSQVEVWWFLPAEVWWFSSITGSHLQSGEGR